MSRRSLLSNVSWAAGSPEGPILSGDRGPLIYQDEDGEIFTLNPLELIPPDIVRYCWLFEQSFKRVKTQKPKPNGNGARGLNPTQADAMYREFVKAYIQRYNLQEVLNPYRRTNADFTQRAQLVNDRGGDWVLSHWSQAVENYFNPDRFQGKHTLADLCTRIDAVLAWRPKYVQPSVQVSEARGRW